MAENEKEYATSKDSYQCSECWAEGKVVTSSKKKTIDDHRKKEHIDEGK